jgi:hypothetical protein
MQYKISKSQGDFGLLFLYCLLTSSLKNRVFYKRLNDNIL